MEVYALVICSIWTALIYDAIMNRRKISVFWASFGIALQIADSAYNSELVSAFIRGWQS